MLYHMERSPRAPEAEQWVRQGLGVGSTFRRRRRGWGGEESSLYREQAVGGA